MRTTEYNRIEEKKLVNENNSYNEANSVDEFLNFKVKLLSEENTATPLNKQADKARKQKSKKHRNIITTTMATVGSTAIVTIAIVASLLSVSLLNKDVGYDYLSYNLSVTANNQPLYAKLLMDDELIDEIEIADGDISVRFDDLVYDTAYTFIVEDATGNVHYQDTASTLSPVNFYTKDNEPNKLFFNVDLSLFDSVTSCYPHLIDEFNNYYELNLSETWEEETEIDLDSLVAGEYTFVLSGYFGETSDNYYEFYHKTVNIDGNLAFSIYYLQDDFDFDTVYFNINNKLNLQYTNLRLVLINDDNIEIETIENSLVQSNYNTGAYTVALYGTANGQEQLLHNIELYI